MNGKADTKTRILDTAEKLFGQNGFDSTSLRDITAEAGVNLAAVNYHFQTKESLIDAVIARRIEPVNRRRLEMLDAAGAEPSIEQVIEAFVGPLLEQDVSKIAPLIGRVLSTPDEFVMRIFRNHMGAILQRFDVAIMQAVPGLTAIERLWRLLFTGGALANVMTRSSFLNELTGGESASDPKTTTARLVKFASAGFRAPGGA